MLLIQFTGYSGAGKSTLAFRIKKALERQDVKVEVLDGDEFRKNLCADLGFSREDRMTNIRRLGFVGHLLARNGIVSILAAINPFEEVRQELRSLYPNVKTIWIKCSLETLIQRDTKGYYQRALLPDGHPDKIYNLTGINDLYENPAVYDLMVNTDELDVAASEKLILDFIIAQLQQI